MDDGKIAYTYVTAEDLESVNAVYGDHEGIVDVGRDIEGVEVSIFVRANGKNKYKVSLRSNDNVDVDEIALLFGGGGHPKAAAFASTESLETIKNQVLTEVRHYLYL